jgi:hypothetical protein
MCFAGICLGDSVDQLPKVSANGYSVKTAGMWHVLSGASLTGTDMDRIKRIEEDLQAFESMKKLNRLCTLPAANDPLKLRMRLAFTPDDASPEGIEVVAEVLPKREPSTSSTYAITQIRMVMRQVPSDLALDWADQVSKMWPGLSPLISEDSKRLPDHYVSWSTQNAAPKGASDSRKTIVNYSVEPVLAVSDQLFNSNQWRGRIVTHELQWSHGISKSMKTNLASQADCTKEK